MSLDPEDEGRMFLRNTLAFITTQSNNSEDQSKLRVLKETHP
jgi:hypothetical protein